LDPAAVFLKGAGVKL